MNKRRYVSTSFWDDWYITECDPIEKLMFLYFLTNTLTNVAWIYEIPFRRISYDTWIDKEMVSKILERFSKKWKIFYIDWWIYIRNFEKHQNIENSKIKEGINRIKQWIPSSILEKIWVIDESYITHRWVSINLDLDLDSDLDASNDAPPIKEKPTLKNIITDQSLIETRWVDLLQEFINYWCERDKKWNERRTKEKTRELDLRLAKRKRNKVTNFGNDTLNYTDLRTFDRFMKEGKIDILKSKLWDKYGDIKAQRVRDPLFFKK